MMLTTSAPDGINQFPNAIRYLTLMGTAILVFFLGRLSRELNTPTILAEYTEKTQDFKATTGRPALEKYLLAQNWSLHFPKERLSPVFVSDVAGSQLRVL